MSASLRWTSKAIRALPDDGKRYEIIDGELYVSNQPHWSHQLICGRIFAALHSWSHASGMGHANLSPGLILSEENDVAPDVIWISDSRLASVLGSDGKLSGAPELVVEVLSPGRSNERRDRDAKLRLYSRHKVSEYWNVDWRRSRVELFRRLTELELDRVLERGDTLETNLLPDFLMEIDELLQGVPRSRRSG